MIDRSTREDSAEIACRRASSLDSRSDRSSFEFCNGTHRRRGLRSLPLDRRGSGWSELEATVLPGARLKDAECPLVVQLKARLDLEPEPDPFEVPLHRVGEAGEVGGP